ncbi:hypothetical protein CapIbe_008951 [Capra ibex]
MMLRQHLPCLRGACGDQIHPTARGTWRSWKDLAQFLDLVLQEKKGITAVSGGNPEACWESGSGRKVKGTLWLLD